MRNTAQRGDSLDQPAAKAITAPRGRKHRRFSIGAFLAIGFWATLIILIVSAATVPGFIVFALLPLAGMPYLLFCWIALTGDRDVE